MHAYRMQQLIKERHKDEVVNVAQRNSIYQTLDRLLRDELIAVSATERDENRPERTVYELTPTGRDTLIVWLHTMLSTPAREFPEFPAALAFIATFSSAEALAALETRVGMLETQLSTVDNDLKQGSTFLPRVFLLESEYQREVIAAELTWVRAVTADLRSHRLHW